MSMEVSFFTSCPITGGLSVLLQTLRTSNSSLSSRAFVRVRRFEAAYRLVFVRPALPVPRPGRDREAREYMNIILVRKDYSVRSSKPNPCMPGLGQGHGKKRHLHAYSPVNFKELKCYKVFNRGVSNDPPALRGAGGKYLATSMGRQVHKYMQSVLGIH